MRRHVAGAVPQGMVLGLVLINVSISGPWDGTECILSEFASDTKLKGVVDGPGAAIQRDLDKLEKGARRNLMKYSKGKRRVLHLWRNICALEQMGGAEWLEIDIGERDLSFVVDKEWNMSQQCTLGAKVNSILCFIEKSIPMSLVSLLQNVLGISQREPGQGANWETS